MPTSLMRAAVILSLCTWGVVLGREPVSLNSLCLTAIIMLCANPLCLWDVSFQMSFMAVAAILVLYRPLYEFIVFMLPHSLGRWRLVHHALLLWAVFVLFPSYQYGCCAVGIGYHSCHLIVLVCASACHLFLRLAFISISGTSLASCCVVKPIVNHHCPLAWCYTQWHHLYCL